MDGCIKEYMASRRQRHAKRDLRTYAKSVVSDAVSDQGLHFLTHVTSMTHIFPWCVYILIMNRCFKHRIGADLGLHYVKCQKVPFHVTLAIYKPGWPHWSLAHRNVKWTLVITSMLVSQYFAVITNSWNSLTLSLKHKCYCNQCRYNQGSLYKLPIQ